MKNLPLAGTALLLIVFAIIFSCKHQRIITCEDLSFKIEASKTDAVLSSHNGTITVKASGGEGFKYSIDGKQYQDSGYFTGLVPLQTYTVYGKNSMGCIDSANLSIGSFNPCGGVIIKLTSTKKDANAGKSDGSITVSATGGSNFKYSINGGSFTSANTFANLAAGNYSVAAKSDAGCLGTAAVTIGTIDPCAGVTIAISTTKVAPSLNQSNGSITATATGGSGFTYSLNNGPFQVSGIFSNLAAGSYTVKAKNSNGCTGVTNVSLEPANPCAGVTVTVSSTKVDPTTGQSNGSITATATGGSGFTYSLNNGTYQSSGTFSNLATGNYTITAKNSNGCTGVTTVALGSTNPCAGIIVAVSATQINPGLGQSNGSITVSASGGSGFTYSINNGAYQSSSTFSGLGAGTYTITAKNSNGCLGTKSVALTAVDPCAGITVTVSATTVSPTTGQSNGSITASATGGSGFTYSINNGTYQSSPTFANLASGTYTITAKNSNGCLGTKTVTLTATSACATITISANVLTATPCEATTNNGSIAVTATGSTGFTYNNNGGAYQSSNVFSSLAAGTYLVGVKDSRGCTQTQSVTVGVTPKGPLFTSMRSLITTRCTGTSCHMNGASKAGYNFDSDCNIIKYWSQINGACITGKLKTMPVSPQAPLTATEKKVITDWITAGHTYKN